MAFFEDLGKKVSQTSQDAIKKTKILAETTKLNSQISGEKKIIGENMTKLGEKYFELFCESPDENLAGIVAIIKAAKQRIESLEDEICKLKGMQTCPKCGAEFDDEVLFCNVCGTKMPEAPVVEAAPQPVGKACPNCGTQLAAGVLFCSSCGTKTE